VLFADPVVHLEPVYPLVSTKWGGRDDICAREVGTGASILRGYIKRTERETRVNSAMVDGDSRRETDRDEREKESTHASQQSL
jgi:hypothetical protein